jgi:hypothetical protein
MIYYRIISKEILAEGLTEEDAFIALDIYKEQGKQNISIEKYHIHPRLGRDPDLH